METLVEFVGRLRRSVDCYYHRCSAGYFALKKVDTMNKGEMGVFAYVLELTRTARFRVDLWKNIADRAAVSQFSDGEKPNLMFGRPGVFFFVRKDSNSEDYRKAVKALRAILPLK